MPIIIFLYRLTISLFTIIQKICTLLFISNNTFKYCNFALLNIILIILSAYYKKIYLYPVNNNIINKKKFDLLFNNTAPTLDNNSSKVNNDNINIIASTDFNSTDSNSTDNVIDNDPTNNETNHQQKMLNNKNISENITNSKNIKEVVNIINDYSKIKIAKNTTNKKEYSVNTKIKNILYDIPKNMFVLDYKLTPVPQDIINFIIQDNYKFNDNKMKALSAYLIAKTLFTQLFKNELDKTNSMLTLNYFMDVYTKHNESNGTNVQKYNFYLKMYNKYETSLSKKIDNSYKNLEYFCLCDSTIIKIKNTKSLIYIENALQANKLFISKRSNDIIFSYGECVDVNIDYDTIEKLFNDLMQSSEVKKYYKYNKVKIMCWTSVVI